MKEEDFKELTPSPQKGLYNASHVTSGIPIPKTQRVQLFDADEWEEFTEEWASSLQGTYHRVRRFAGAGDQGIDIVGFVASAQFSDGWDNYQCKFYNHPLIPSDVWVEFGKIIYFSFLGDYPAPRKYYFVAPKQIGTKLSKLLASSEKLKESVQENWPKYCEPNITSTSQVVLEGELLAYFEKFDFSIFDTVPLVEMIEGHSNTSFHTVRFGGGLGVRPEPEIPPEDTVSLHHRYVRHLLGVYAEKMGETVETPDLALLTKDEEIRSHFSRQRERFYHAESLRNFSRDTVPPGTFENLQDDIYQGVVDICESHHASGMDRLSKTLSQAATVVVESNPLASATRVKDKQGMCHQLVNDARLSWSDEDE